MTIDLTSNPEWYPFDAAHGDAAVGFVRLDATAYSDAAFLDERLLTAGARGVRVPWPEVKAAVLPLRRHSHFVFHISHVGSTLLARLLGLHPELFALREPRLLRRFAVEGGLQTSRDREELTALTALWSRVWSPGQTALVKCTSIVNAIAATLMEMAPEAKALAMTVPPRTFLATLLGGAMSDITGNAAARWRRLQTLGITGLRPPTTPGETVAMAWLAEMFTLGAAVARSPERFAWLNFDDYLADPHQQLKRVLVHFGVEASDSTVTAILTHPLASAYSKAPVYRFDGEVRRGILATSAVTHAAEIDRGLAWLTGCETGPEVGGLIREAIGR